VPKSGVPKFAPLSSETFVFGKNGLPVCGPEGGGYAALGRCLGHQHGALKTMKNVKLSSFLGFWGGQLEVKSIKNVQLSSFLGFWGCQLGVKSMKNAQLSSFLGFWAPRVAKSPK
jgi:hypothetical protein